MELSIKGCQKVCTFFFFLFFMKKIFSHHPFSSSIWSVCTCPPPTYPPTLTHPPRIHACLLSVRSVPEPLGHWDLTLLIIQTKYCTHSQCWPCDRESCLHKSWSIKHTDKRVCYREDVQRPDSTAGPAAGFCTLANCFILYNCSTCYCVNVKVALIHHLFLKWSESCCMKKLLCLF